MTEQEIISDTEIERVHANANFGSYPKRDVVKFGVLKAASGFYDGSTAKAICTEHGLFVKDSFHSTPTLTTKGGQYLWAAFGKDYD